MNLKFKEKRNNKWFVVLLLLFLAFGMIATVMVSNGGNWFWKSSSNANGSVFATQQQVDAVNTKEGEIAVSGYEMFEHYDMSETDNVEHTLVFKGDVEHEVEVVNKKREDITEYFKTHRTNYDYAGYETALGFYDISSIPEGDYVLNTRTKIIDEDIEEMQVATLDESWLDQELSNDEVGGATFRFYVEDREIHLEKTNSDFETEQKIEEILTRGSEVSILGFQLYEGYDMSDYANIEHTMYFDSVTSEDSFPISLDNKKREDVTEHFDDEGINYDYAGYQTDGFYDVATIPAGKYVLNIETQIIEERIKEVQKASVDMDDKVLTEHSVNGETYLFYVDNNNVYLEKETTILTSQQEVGEVKAKGSEISVKGFQLFEHFDMSTAGSVKHNLFFQETKTNSKYQISTASTNRGDVTNWLGTHGTNYNYSGYQTTGGYFDLKSIKEGKYELKIRTQLPSQGLDTTQSAIYYLSNRTLSNDEIGGFVYRFYIQNNKVYLEKSISLARRKIQQEVETITTQGSEMSIKGFQLFEYYDMTSSSNVKHTMFFEELSTKKKQAVSISSEKRPDITSRFSSHDTNYDYSGYKTSGFYDLSSIAVGEYKLKIQTQILSENITEIQNAKHKNIRNKDLSKHKVGGYTYYFYIRNNDIYLEKTQFLQGAAQQEVETVKTQGAEISIKGYQLAEYTDMSSLSNVEHEMFFEEVDTNAKYTIDATPQKRIDITNLYSLHGTNYDYAGYETNGYFDVSSIPLGEYKLNIKTTIAPGSTVITQSATMKNETDKVLTEHSVGGETYRFYIQNNEIYLDKTTTGLKAHQGVEVITAHGSMIEIEGFQLYGHHDMSVESNISHSMIFAETSTQAEYMWPIDTKKREDITLRYIEHGTNYDYSGYEMASGAEDMSVLANGVYELKVRTEIRSDGIDETQTVNFSTNDKTISSDVINGIVYNFYVQNSKVYLDKNFVPTSSIQELESITTQGSKINIKGFQLYEYYDMSVQANVEHYMNFKSIDSASSFELMLDVERRTDITAKYSSHNTNYDYSGYQTIPSANDVALIPEGEYKLNIRTNNIASNIDEDQIAYVNLGDTVLSNDVINGVLYKFYIQNNEVYLEKSSIPMTTKQNVEKVTTKGSEISIEGYQLYEYYDMSSQSDINHELFFIDQSTSGEHSLATDSAKRTGMYPGHNTNYDYSGYETQGGTFVDVFAMSEGIHELNIRTQIISQGIDEYQVAISDLPDQVTSENAINGVRYKFYIENSNVYLNKSTLPVTTQQEVETIITQGSEIGVEGYQLYEYYDMSNQANVVQELFFIDDKTGLEFSIDTDTTVRYDITANYPLHATNYDAAGYETGGRAFFDVAAIPDGTHELNIRTQIIDQGIDEFQSATYNSGDQVLSQDAFNGLRYKFYIENEKILLEKSMLPITTQQEVEQVITQGSEISLQGYQLYEYYDMGDITNVNHELFFVDNQTTIEYPFGLDSKNRPDVTAMFSSHNTNYNYAGYDTTGGYIDVSSIPEGAYELMVRTQIIEQGINEVQSATSNIGNLILSQDAKNGVKYKFYIQNNKILLEKSTVPMITKQEVESITTQGSQMNIQGFQLYECYDMSVQSNIEHNLFFKDINTGTEYPVSIDNPYRSDLTASFPSHNTNYDYAGYETTGGTYVDVSSVPHGQFELNIRTQIKDQGIDEVQPVHSALIDQVLSNDVASGEKYSFTINQNKVYLEKAYNTITTQQEVETITTQGSKIAVVGYQLYEYYNMGDPTNIVHELYFEDLSTSNEFSIDTNVTTRSDITILYPHNTDYKHAGYETDGTTFDVKLIPNGKHQLMIRTEILDESISESQIATTNLMNQILSEDSANGATFKFYIENNRIYLEKTPVQITLSQEVESITTQGSEISISGYQLYESFDMSVDSNIRHQLYFKDTNTNLIFPIQTSNVYRPDITANTLGNTNYDYAGYETTGGFVDVELIPLGTHRLNIRSQILDQSIDEFQIADSNLTTQTLSKDTANGNTYHFYILGGKLYLQKEKLEITVENKIDLVITANSKIYFEGYQFFEYYDMSDQSDIQHNLIFKGNDEYTIGLENAKRIDVTANNQSHNTNYDYSGFNTAGGALDVTLIPEGLYELAIETKILSENATKDKYASTDISDGTLSKDIVTGTEYHFFVSNSKIYLEKTQQPVIPILEIENIVTQNDEISFDGYQLYTNLDMSKESEVSHQMLWSDTTTDDTIPFDLNTVKRTDVTDMYPAHNTNYDYAGFSTVGNYQNVSSLPDGTFKLIIRTDVFNGIISEEQAAITKLNNQILTDTFYQNCMYKFYVENKEIFLEKESVIMPSTLVIESHNLLEGGFMNLSGYQFYTSIDMSVESYVEHTLVLESDQDTYEYALETVKRTDVSATYPNTYLNYDYSGFTTSSNIDLNLLNHGSYKVYIRTNIIDRYIDQKKELPWVPTNSVEVPEENVLNTLRYHYKGNTLYCGYLFGSSDLAIVESIKFTGSAKNGVTLQFTGYNLSEKFVNNPMATHSFRHDGFSGDFGASIAVYRPDVTAKYAPNTNKYDYSGFVFDVKIDPRFSTIASLRPLSLITNANGKTYKTPLYFDPNIFKPRIIFNSKDIHISWSGYEERVYTSEFKVVVSENYFMQLLVFQTSVPV